ncbi:MAG: hypothetical protein DME47_07025 [Verrucomicrobia bacterium]|nr:MAG: hypothetical protein DME47_07025 [Verrucomicrobiota bacterium]
MARLLQYDNLVKRVRLQSLATRRVSVLVAILVAGAAGNASAVIRSPFPSRPMPPYHGHYIMIGGDSITAWPKAVTSTPSR